MRDKEMHWSPQHLAKRWKESLTKLKIQGGKQISEQIKLSRNLSQVV